MAGLITPVSVPGAYAPNMAGMASLVARPQAISPGAQFRAGQAEGRLVKDEELARQAEGRLVKDEELARQYLATKRASGITKESLTRAVKNTILASTLPLGSKEETQALQLALNEAQNNPAIANAIKALMNTPVAKRPEMYKKISIFAQQSDITEQLSDIRTPEDRAARETSNVTAIFNAQTKRFEHDRKVIKDRNDLTTNQKTLELNKLKFKEEQLNTWFDQKTKIFEQQFGTAPPTDFYRPDEKDPSKIEPLKGGKEEASRAEVKQKLVESYDAVVFSGDRVIKQLSDAYDKTGLLTTGFLGKLFGVIWGTPAFDFKQGVETVKAAIGLDKLMEMKRSSTRGASGLGALSEKELEVLQNHIANLETAQSPIAFKKSLTLVTESYKRLMEQVKANKEHITGVKTEITYIDESQFSMEQLEQMLKDAD